MTKTVKMVKLKEAAKILQREMIKSYQVGYAQAVKEVEEIRKLIWHEDYADMDTNDMILELNKRLEAMQLNLNKYE